MVQLESEQPLCISSDVLKSPTTGRSKSPQLATTPRWILIRFIWTSSESMSKFLRLKIWVEACSEMTWIRFAFLHSLPRWCGQRVPSLDVQMSTSMWDGFHFKFLICIYCQPNYEDEYDMYLISRRRPSRPPLIPTLLSATMPSAATLLGDLCIPRFSSHTHLFWTTLKYWSQIHLLFTLTGTGLLFLPLLNFLCRLPLPAHKSLNKRIVLLAFK